MSPEWQNKDFEEVIRNSFLLYSVLSTPLVSALYVKLRSLSKDKASNLMFTLGKEKSNKAWV
ncbi:MAG: hypothetical protein V7L01_31755 [Nostoc sp.]|uniref:hypothetical protein n=1 Tax=Nostoc sp. TaxID=1180 RepID=UPI002FFAB49B